ncbi:MAG: hypothetical protein M1836_006440 [Candelina mexicana]|nr:MAG: hypothetical protein M1836_006440 [Candelina mexicana]
MDFVSYESSYGPPQPEWSAIASVLPSVFDSSGISNTFITDQDLLEASEFYSLPSVDVIKDAYWSYEPVLLGSGASYRVYIQMFRQWNRPVAIKYIRSSASPGNHGNLSSAAQKLTVLQEIHSLSLLNDHPNITNLLAWGQHGIDNSAFLITEHAPLGSLDCFLREHGRRMKAKHLFKICADVAEGIHGMHSQRMIHGDIKAANILIFEEASHKGYLTAKLSDLGFSINVDFDDGHTCYRGTNIYNAPEIRVGESRRIQDINPFACDVYSLGLLVWTVFKHGEFFLAGVQTSAVGENSEEQILDSIDATQLLDHAVQFALARQSRDEARVLAAVMSACLQVDCRARLSIRSICKILDSSATQSTTISMAKTRNGLAERQFSRLRFPDIFAFREARFSQKAKTQLAQKLLTAAENPKNPKAADLAFEASKCFAAGFGVSEDVQSMELWLSIAAKRDHLFAKALCTKLKISGKDAIPAEEMKSSVNPEPDITSLVLEMECTYSKAKYNSISVEHIGDLEIYASDDMVAIRSVIQKKLSKGLNIESITGNTDWLKPDAHSRAGMPLLHWAAGSGRIGLVQVLLSFGINIDSIDPFYHRTPLAIALDSGEIAVAELLLRGGADIYKPDRIGLIASYFIGNVPPGRFDLILQLFIRASKATLVGSERPRLYQRIANTSKERDWPLLAKAFIGHIQAVRYFLDEIGHDLTAQDFSEAVQYAAAGLHANLCDILLLKAFQSFDTLPNNPFYSIAHSPPYVRMLLHGRRWPEALEATIVVLLSHGIDINGFGVDRMTPIDLAVLLDQQMIASVFRAYGASIEQKSAHSLTTLEYAIASVANSKNIGCVSWLLSCGVPIEQLKGVYEPLYLACIFNASGAAEIILRHRKTDINARSNEGETPLYVASMMNALESVQLLLDHGADATIVSDRNRTPLEAAVHGRCIEVVEYFLKNHLSIFNTHFMPPRSILAWYIGVPESDRSRLWRLLLEYIQSHAPEALHGKGVHDRSLLKIAVSLKRHYLIPDLIHAGVIVENPHNQGSEWATLISSDQRLYDHEKESLRHQLEYRKALQAFVEAFKKQDLLYSLNEEGQTLMFSAALCGAAVAVSLLLDAGLSALSVDFHGSTILHSALLGAFHLVPEKMELPQQVEKTPRDQRPAKVQALAAISLLLLDAGLDPNSEPVDGVPPLYMAIMASWHLENTALVELLCERGAQSDTVTPVLCGAQPLHVALEAQIFIQASGVDILSPPLHISLDEQGDVLKTKKLMITRSLVQLLTFAGVSFNSHKDWRKNSTAEAIWKCRPLGLQAMLAEGVSLAEALGTGQAACHHAAQWVEAAGKRRERDHETRLVESASVWLKARLRCRVQNEEILRQYIGRTGRSTEIEELPPIDEEHENAHYQSYIWSQIRLVLREPFAEFWGAFILILFGDASVAQVMLTQESTVAPGGRGYGEYQSVTWSWAIAVMLGVYVAGGSGGHINPAVTFTNCLYRGLPWRRFPIYFLAQFLGGFCAAGVVYANYVAAIDNFEGVGVRTVPPHKKATAVFALQDISNYGTGKLLLFPLGMFFLMFAIGASLGFQTGYALSFARDFGPRLMSYMVGYGHEVWSAGGYYFWIPMVIPFLGCAFGGLLYDLFIYTGESPVKTPCICSKRFVKSDVLPIAHLSRNDSSSKHSPLEQDKGIPLRQDKRIIRVEFV